MRRFLRLTAVAAAALGLTACATLSVSSHVERDLDFAQYRTYDWGPADALPTGDPRLDQDPFFRDHVEGAVEKGLDARGFERATFGAPDLLIHYHASIARRLDVNRVDRDRGYCPDNGCQVDVIDYEAGTLILDIVDAASNRLIWRGWARDGADGLLTNHDRMAQKINEGVRRMLERLPRGPARSIATAPLAPSLTFMRRAPRRAGEQR